MTDFLLELRCEEIPARMQAGARADLEKLLRKELADAGVSVGEVTVWSTPRRLVLIAPGLPEQTQAVREETKGPAASAPEQALEGFLRKVGLTKDQLEVRDLKGKDTYFAVIEKPGRALRDVLAEAIPAIVRAFPWPKSMRWGAESISTESVRWVRPLSGIVAILGEELVDCEVGGVRSGYATMGHRFHHPDEITIGGAHDYADKLRACHVIVDHEERQDLIRQGAARAAADAGLKLVEDEGLVIENAGLTEWPVPLLGRFDEAFLEVPPEVIQLTARVNQKYFVCTRSPAQAGASSSGEDGRAVPASAGTQELANAFVCTANIDAADGGEAIVAGNRKVLAARLSDARFFWEQDLKTPLAEQAKKLGRITFHEKLGTVADKVDRVARLARWLVEEGIVGAAQNAVAPAQAGAHPGPVMDSRLRGNDGEAVKRLGSRIPAQAGASGVGSPSDAVPAFAGTREELADMAEQAAGLCKADLVTEMVGEFPELQGLMGGYYARAEGLPDEVADAIRDHYKPVGQGDEVPTAPVTVAVSLADKLDTLVGFFVVNERPTGSKDPFALRRAALSIIQLLALNKIRLGLRTTIPVISVPVVMRLALRAVAALEIERSHFKILYSGIEDGEVNFDVNDQSSFVRELLPRIPEKLHRSIVDTLHDATRSLSGERSPSDLLEFFADRLKVQQREAGVRHDLIDAVFALGNEDDLVRLLARVNALQSFIQTDDGANLLAAYKRAANILKKEDWHGTEGEIARTGEEDPLAMVDDPDLKAVVDAKMAQRHNKELSYTPEPAEKDLIDALALAGPKAEAAVAAEDFEGAMAALASLRGPIDAFFDNVTVNDPDPDKRRARLELLDAFRAAVHNVADFSKIEG